LTKGTAFDEEDSLFDTVLIKTEDCNYDIIYLFDYYIQLLAAR